MTRRDWWLGTGVIVVALLLHALVPRYEWRAGAEGMLLRVDRWTGTVTMPGGRTVTYRLPK